MLIRCLLVGWHRAQRRFVSWNQCAKAQRRMADLCRRYHARFQRQVSNLRVSQSSWDHSPMELVACSAMGQKRTLVTTPFPCPLCPKADVSARGAIEDL